MFSKLFVREDSECPFCGHRNRVLFYALDLVSVRFCDHCSHVVEFRGSGRKRGSSEAASAAH